MTPAFTVGGHRLPFEIIQSGRDLCIVDAAGSLVAVVPEDDLDFQSAIVTAVNGYPLLAEALDRAARALNVIAMSLPAASREARTIVQREAVAAADALALAVPGACSLQARVGAVAGAVRRAAKGDAS